MSLQKLLKIKKIHVKLQENWIDIVTEEPDPKKNGNENGKTSDPIEAEGAALEQDTLCYLK